MGVLPFDAKRLRQAAWREMQRIIQEEEPPRPSARLTTLGRDGHGRGGEARDRPPDAGAGPAGDLDWITLKALEKDRTRRYQSASELAADVRRHLRDEPVTAGPPGPRLSADEGDPSPQAAVRRGRGGGDGRSCWSGWPGHDSVPQGRGRPPRDPRQVVRLHVAKGMGLVDAGDRDHGPALAGRGAASRGGRVARGGTPLRIGTALDPLPALYRLWAHERQVTRRRVQPGRPRRGVGERRPDGARLERRHRRALSPPLRHDGPVQRWRSARTVRVFSPGARTARPGCGMSRVRDAGHSGPSRVARLSRDDSASVWDAAHGRRVATFEHTGDVNWISFSSDGRWLVTGSEDGRWRVWDIATGRAVTAPLPNEIQAPVTMALITRHGRRVVGTGA